MSFCSGDYRRAYRIVWEKTTVVMQKLFLSLFMGAILSACTVDVELSGREETGPMSRISDWWYGDRTMNSIKNYPFPFIIPVIVFILY